MVAGELRIRLLGGLEVEGTGNRELGSRKARTLVKVLALGRGAPVHADRIVDCLWGDDPPTRPVDQIGVLVSRLRPALGAERLRRTDAGWALTVDWLDVDELETRVDEADARLAAGSHAAALAAADAALALVRGELLADEPDAPWADIDRAAAHRLVARARVLHAQAALEVGRPADAAASAEGALGHDPYDEAALRVLMRAHVAAGRPASALAAYANVRERLSEDLGVDPVAETEALHTAVLLGDPVVSSAAVPRRGHGQQPRSIVGREPELAELDQTLDAITRAGTAGIVIEGEAGIGKTTLVDEWVPRAREAALVLTGRCDELGRDLPLQPVLDGLATHLRQLGTREAEALLGDDHAALDPLLGRGSVMAPRDEATTVADPAIGQAALFAALLAVVERVAAGRPMVVVVEDLHRAGASTVEWLWFALHRSERLMVLATTRPGAERALSGAVTVELGPLDLDAVTELVGANRAGELHARSGGHPLFLVELAASTSSELPASVRESVATRVESLADAAPTLRAAAVLGRDVDIDALAGVLGLPVPELLGHIDAGERASIIEEQQGALVFRHELVREALVADTTAARRAFIHREAARVLGDRPTHDPLEVAWHAQRGGDPQAASAALVEAAAIASDRYDSAAAEELLGRAIELHDDAVARLARARVRIARWDADGARADAHYALEHGGGVAALEVAGWVEYYQRDYDTAFRYADEAVERADDDALRASCLAMTGRVLHAKGDVIDADLRLTAAAAAAPPSVRGIAWLSGLRMHQGRPEEALDLVERALLDATRFGHPFARNHSHMFRSLSLGQRGRIRAAFESVAAGRVVAREAGEQGHRFVFVSDNVESWLLRGVGRFDEADAMSAQVVEAAAAPGTATSEMYCAALLDLLEGRLLAGDMDAVPAALERAAPVSTLAGTMAWHHRQRLTVQQARAELLGGNPSAARQLAAAAVADAAARGTDRYRCVAGVVEAVAAGQEGDPVDRDAIDALLAGLDRCAALEAWWLTAELAAAVSEERWWRDAERRAGWLIGRAGDDAETLQRHVAATFSALGRR